MLRTRNSPALELFQILEDLHAHNKLFEESHPSLNMKFIHISHIQSAHNLKIILHNMFNNRVHERVWDVEFSICDDNPQNI